MCHLHHHLHGTNGRNIRRGPDPVPILVHDLVLDHVPNLFHHPIQPHGITIMMTAVVGTVIAAVTVERRVIMGTADAQMRPQWIGSNKAWFTAIQDHEITPLVHTRDLGHDPIHIIIRPNLFEPARNHPRNCDPFCVTTILFEHLGRLFPRFTTSPCRNLRSGQCLTTDAQVFSTKKLRNICAPAVPRNCRSIRGAHRCDCTAAEAMESSHHLDFFRLLLLSIQRRPRPLERAIAEAAAIVATEAIVTVTAAVAREAKMNRRNRKNAGIYWNWKS